MKKSFAFAVLLLFLSACSGKQEAWTLTGELPDGVKTATLELPSAVGGWYTADTIAATEGKNRFTIVRKPANLEIYRLNIDGKYVYVPADSTETLELSISPEGNYVLSGSHEATLFSNVNAILDAPADSTTRRRLLLALQDDFGSTAAYYANLRLRGQDRRLLRAVANAYSSTRPDDPRTAVLLNQLKQQTKPTVSNETIVIEAPELGYFDIELMNSKGEYVALSSVVDSHAVTLLSFVDFTNEYTPAVNMMIGDIFTSYPQIGIYEVGFGENQHQWANASKELPWVNVFQSESATKTHLTQYAITSIPAFFIIRNGEITDRIDNIENLKESIKKYL